MILASQSPRRSELLTQEGYEFSVVPSDSDETFDENENIDAALEKVAANKARAVQTGHEQDCIIAADTIVYFEDRILGKPTDKGEAAEMLLDLSGKWHEVKTAVCVLRGKMEITFTCTSWVHFRDLSDKEILDYVNTGKPLDKAGAYGIQEVNFVGAIIGDYNNIVGLPVKKLNEVLHLLKEMDQPQTPAYYF
jgi:septum formation protein